MLFIEAAFAEIIIRGKVFKHQNNEPIKNVNVYTNSKRGTSTNNKGEFVFQIMQDDSVLIFEHIGFNKFSQKIDQNERKGSLASALRVFILKSLIEMKK